MQANRAPQEFLIKGPSDGFLPGLTWITREEKALDETGVDFGILVLKKGQLWSEKSSKECAFILLSGSGRIAWENNQKIVSRQSLFDENPSALHVSAQTSVRIEAVDGPSEWALVRVENSIVFQSRFFEPNDIQSENRGEGLVQNACTRNVKSIFDLQNRSESCLVIGEVVNWPGKWSSYPPHHHAQPEIYHYRFTLPQGYGHAEVGETVMKVRQGDTVEIPGGFDHSQVSAAGYGMYYLWIVKHLKNNPYKGFEFTEEHRWILDPKNQGWEPKK